MDSTVKIERNDLTHKEKWTVTTGDLVTVFSSMQSAAGMIACLHEQIIRMRQGSPVEPPADGAAE